jgi:hypothetical protein
MTIVLMTTPPRNTLYTYLALPTDRQSLGLGWNFMSKVTRLGEFSPIGRLFMYFTQFLLQKYPEFWGTFNHSTCCV